MGSTIVLLAEIPEVAKPGQKRFELNIKPGQKL